MQIGDERLTQLIVIHDDGYARAYAVRPADFMETLAAEASATEESVTAGTRYRVCSNGESKAAIKAKVQEMMKNRPFLGGCEKGRKLLAEHGPQKMAAWKDLGGLQMWDPTEGAWFSGHILGMSGAHSATNWVLLFDDDTEYDIDPKTTVWKLARPSI
jgi:hypothetical protein